MFTKSSTIRRLTRLVKDYYPLMRRIPRPLARPGNQSYLARQNAAVKDLQARQEEYERLDSKRLDKTTIRFFAEQYSQENRR